MLNYAPFIQFVAAIYFAMCFEQVLEKFFWNKRHLEATSKLIDNFKQKFGLDDEQESVKNFEVIFNKKREDFNVFVTRWSIGCLIFSIGILFWIAIEQRVCSGLSFFWCNTASLGLIIPGSFFLIKGRQKSHRFNKKVNKIIAAESQEYSKAVLMILGREVKCNKDYQEVLTKVVLSSEDTTSKAQLIVEVQEAFRQFVVAKIIDTIENK